MNFAPFPRISIVRVAGADRNRADMHITIVDVPALVGGFHVGGG
jgi:hypothetical protein